MKGGQESEKMTKEKALTCRGLRQGKELDSTSFRRSESLAALYARVMAIKHLQRYHILRKLPNYEPVPKRELVKFWLNA